MISKLKKFGNLSTDPYSLQHCCMYTDTGKQQAGTFASKCENQTNQEDGNKPPGFNFDDAVQCSPSDIQLSSRNLLRCRTINGGTMPAIESNSTLPKGMAELEAAPIRMDDLSQDATAQKLSSVQLGSALRERYDALRSSKTKLPCRDFVGCQNSIATELQHCIKARVVANDAAFASFVANTKGPRQKAASTDAPGYQPSGKNGSSSAYGD